MNRQLSIKDLDKEWVELILQALEIGISTEEIRIFFNQSSRPS
ncbi:anti-repressor SinI family protein [Salipaludibacillus neizhouensis]|nr:anti-repressor SinI family protein [Salipaludibacillus neizhouensis]